MGLGTGYYWYGVSETVALSPTFVQNTSSGAVVFTPARQAGRDDATGSSNGFQPQAFCTCPVVSVSLTAPNVATVMGTGIPTITVPPGPGQFFQVLGGGSYERLILVDRINGYEIRQVDKTTSGIFEINRLGLFSLTVTNSDGCSRTVQGILANP